MWSTSTVRRGARLRALLSEQLHPRLELELLLAADDAAYHCLSWNIQVAWHEAAHAALAWHLGLNPQMFWRPPQGAWWLSGASWGAEVEHWIPHGPAGLRLSRLVAAAPAALRDAWGEPGRLSDEDAALADLDPEIWAELEPLCAGLQPLVDRLAWQFLSGAPSSVPSAVINRLALLSG